MAVAAAARVQELLGNVLGRQPADPAIVAGFVEQKVREGLFLEYKRGTWLNTNGSEEVRAHVSAFANAEGGVLVLGIAGDDVPDPDKWTFEPPACPDKAGWDAWLGRVLGDVIAKTRVEWQVLSVKAKDDVVVVAANRAEELIRVPEGRKLVCYLRIADNTVPIDESLFVDLALGRRAKPDITIEQATMEGGNDSKGFHLIAQLIVHNQGLLWVPDVSVAWCGYALQGSGGVLASQSMLRNLDVHPTSRTDLLPVVAPFTLADRAGVWMTGFRPYPRDMRPFELMGATAQIRGLPITAGVGRWVWLGAVMVLPMNGSPRWAQLAIRGGGAEASGLDAVALPPGVAPKVAWFRGPDVPRNLKEFLGVALPDAE